MRSRFGPGYAEVEQAVQDRWLLTGSALREFQAQRLSAHLKSGESSPFWRSRFAEFGVNARASDPFHELAKLPVLTKAEVQNNAGANRNAVIDSRSSRTVHTSGTTGAGLVFWETSAAERERWAVWWRYRKQFGLNLNIRSGLFGGRSVVPMRQTRPPFWRRNYPGRQLLLSAYHLSEETVEDYWRALHDWRAEWLHGYPSFLSLFADLCRRRNLPPLDSVRWITVGAENLLASQRAGIEAVFGVRVRQHYGMSESVANISEREDGRLVVDEDFSFVEFLPSQAAGMGASRILGTNWSNPAFPLFRYDTGDQASVAALTAATSDVWREVDGLDGRNEDYVLLPNGARVGRLDHIFKDLVHIREAQIYQPAAGHLVLRVVKGTGYDEYHEEARLLAEARIRLGTEISLEIEYLHEILKTRTGKLRFVVSDLAAAEAEASSSAALSRTPARRALTATAGTFGGLLGVTVASGYAATLMGGNVGIGTTSPGVKLDVGELLSNSV